MAFSDKVWITRKSRINASERFKRNDLISQILIAYYSFFIIVITIVDIKNDNLNFEILTLILSILILIVSIFIFAMNYKERASVLQTSYVLMSKLYEKIKEKENKKDKYDELRNQYDMIDLISIMNCEYTNNNIKEELGGEDPTLRAFTLSETNQFKSFAYKAKDLKKTLINLPRNFCLFIFALLCGKRQEEALLIAMDDIKVQEINGKKYFYIFLNQDKPYQHLKNKNAHKNITITDLMIDLGLLNYIQIRHNRDCETLLRGSAARTFFSRNLQKLFSEICDTIENRNSRLLDNYIQFRSFRKNFSNFLFEENRSKYDTHENKLRIMEHEHEGSNNVTKHYLRRLEPRKAYEIMNAISYEGIDFTNIIQIIKEHYGDIL